MLQDLQTFLLILPLVARQVGEGLVQLTHCSVEAPECSGYLYWALLGTRGNPWVLGPLGL